MSLINQMLKDLEKRENRAREHVPFPLPMKKQQKRFPVKLFIINTFLFIIVLSGFLIWLAKKPVVHVKPLPSAMVHQAVQNAVLNTPWLQEVKITQLSLHANENTTELNFTLNHPALYHLKNDHNKFSVSFDNATFENRQPLSYRETAIQKIDANRYEQGLRFDLVLNEGASIKDVKMIDEEKNPKLIITFHYAIETNNQNNLIKKQALESVMTEQYQTALQFADLGDVPKATAALVHILQSNPAYHDARVSLAALLMGAGKFTEAKKVIEQGLNLDPAFIPFVELKARLLTNEGKIKEALALLQINAPPLTDNPEYHAFLAALYERNNDNVLAAKIYKSLLTQDAKNGNWWFGLGITLEKLGRTTAAYEAYTHAATSGRVNAESALYLQSRLQEMRGAHEKK